ncbi:Quercetin 2,3-dioxygenase [Pandoraea iniqua]|uniref:Quercetin 2,3-dioxygenase n=1 Tax=Pandoraea iniqua TaxID=2508288 RepID=A0A5E4U809_9BURK|nr:pirin family protein [Pandoraea iniqua]VVD95218.1 Quercetin 2,3-dioxygenase [Pandoraea iniqua]
MLAHRRSEMLDSVDHGWLRAKYHFQVRPAGNPAHKALGPLIVWNDDEIAVDGGFPFHGHSDVEIITYVRQGVLGHRDTLGSEGTIRAGDVQVMSAGTGIRHAEFNKGDVPLKLFQIWLKPRAEGGQPHWDTRAFPKAKVISNSPNAPSGADGKARFTVLASGYYASDEGALPIRADARLLGATLAAGETVRHTLGPSRSAYLVVAAGRIAINGEPMGPLDGVAMTDVSTAEITAFEDAELVMVETG